MTFDRAKIIAEGGKYHGDADPLVESSHFVAETVGWESVAAHGAAPANIREDANLPKRMVIEGVFQRFMPTSIPVNDTEKVKKYRNANKRVYTMERVGKKVLDPNGDVQKRISERAMIGHVEHPSDGTTDLMKGAILITKVWAEADGTIKGRALVYNNEPGKMIQEYVETGTKIGISSRGTGTVDANGFVCEDFQLDTWDMVYNPSTFGAHPGLATQESVTTPATKPVVETSPSILNIQPQVTPMSLSKRISEAKAAVSRLLAVDPKRLTQEGRAQHAAALLDQRAAVAKDFVGEERITDVEKLLKDLAEARTACEDMEGGYRDSIEGAAPEGQVKTGIPGTWDGLDKAVAASGASRVAHEAATKSMAELIAANLGKLPHIAAAVEAAIKGEVAKVTEAKHDELKGLLRESRDEIITLTEREEAASAIIEETTDMVVSLQAEVEAAKLRESKAAAVIAELTGTAGKPKTDEAALAAVAPVVTEAAKAKPVAKTLAERIAEQAKKPAGGTSNLPESGKTVSSAADAGDVKKKAELHEDAKSGKLSAKSGADILVGSGVIKKITEAQGAFR